MGTESAWMCSLLGRSRKKLMDSNRSKVVLNGPTDMSTSLIRTLLHLSRQIGARLELMTSVRNPSLLATVHLFVVPSFLILQRLACQYMTSVVYDTELDEAALNWTNIHPGINQAKKLPHILSNPIVYFALAQITLYFTSVQ